MGRDLDFAIGHKDFAYIILSEFLLPGHVKPRTKNFDCWPGDGASDQAAIS
jgi:hypothetical protein